MKVVKEEVIAAGATSSQMIDDVRTVVVTYHVVIYLLRNMGGYTF